MKRVVLLTFLCLLFAGCATPKQEPCPRCTDIDAHIRAAAEFMPGYWVKYQTEGLEPTGTPHSEEYEVHHRWIEVRDAFQKAEGKTQDE